MQIKKYRVIVRCLLLLFILGLVCTACSTASAEQKDAGADSTVNREETIVSDQQKELGKEEVIDFVYEDCSIDFSAVTREADGVTYNGLYYLRAELLAGREETAEEQLRALCGDGEEVDPDFLPRADNRICRELQDGEPYIRYTYVRSGKNGAKTATTDFYLMKKESATYLFVLGHK